MIDAELYLDTAYTAERAIASPAVVTRWTAPSALTGYSIAGLCGHLARAVLGVERYLDARVPADADAMDAAGYFAHVLAGHDPVDSAFHEQVRRRGEQEADAGPEALADRLESARSALTERFAVFPSDQLIAVLDGVVLSVGEYLDTRLVELVVHLDDVASSLGEAAGDLASPSDAAYERVAGVLARLAARRFGGREVVRGLARRERHPEAIRAL